MKVSSINTNPTLSPNYGAMKASQFNGVDYICMRKLKAPIEKFDTIRDFHRWARDKITNRRYSFPARSEKTDKLRIDLVNKWLQAFCWQPRYPFAFALVFINEICKNLKPTNDDIPDIYNPTALKNTYEEVKTKGQDSQFRFTDIYKKHLKNIIDEKEIPENGWLIIESLQNNPMEYEKNTTKLQVLSHRSWCTKAPYAATHLMYADFHLLMQDKRPRAIIRVMDDGMVEEIQSIGNKGPLPQDLPIIEEYMTVQGFQISPNVQEMIDWVKTTQ